MFLWKNKLYNNGGGRFKSGKTTFPLEQHKEKISATPTALSFLHLSLYQNKLWQ